MLSMYSSASAAVVFTAFSGTLATATSPIKSNALTYLGPISWVPVSLAFLHALARHPGRARFGRKAIRPLDLLCTLGTTHFVTYRKRAHRIAGVR